MLSFFRKWWKVCIFYSKHFTEQFHIHTNIHTVHLCAALFSRDYLGFSLLPKDTLAIGIGKSGIELVTFWLEEDRSSPWAQGKGSCDRRITNQGAGVFDEKDKVNIYSATAWMYLRSLSFNAHPSSPHVSLDVSCGYVPASSVEHSSLKKTKNSVSCQIWTRAGQSSFKQLLSED